MSDTLYEEPHHPPVGGGLGLPQLKEPPLDPPPNVEGAMVIAHTGAGLSSTKSAAVKDDREGRRGRSESLTASAVTESDVPQ